MEIILYEIRYYQGHCVVAVCTNILMIKTIYMLRMLYVYANMKIASLGS